MIEENKNLEENESCEEETVNNEDVKSEDEGDKKQKKAKKLENELAKKEKELEDVKAQLADINDKYMRMLAEYDNFRRRSQKEREGVYSDAYSDAINALLPVLDNLGRAVGCEDPKALADGLALILKSFDEGLAKLGVEEIKALGETFDPERHYAVLHVEDENYGENEVVEVLQKGYTRGDKVIRYAVVKVAN